MVGGKLTFVGAGKKTVELREMSERCESLGIKLDWARIKKVGDLRNSAEHYFVAVSPAVVRAAVAESFLVIRDVVINHLKLDPAELFTTATWQALLADNEVHAAEKAACDRALQAVEWGTAATAEAVAGFSCAKCGSTLFAPGPGETKAPSVNLVCRSCAESYDFDEIIEDLLREHLAGERYLAAKDGDEEPLAECPHCNRDTYIMAEERCGACFEQAQHTCELCENTIPASELDSSGICGYCRHKMEKARDE